MKKKGDEQVGARLDEEIYRVFGNKSVAATEMGLASGSYFNTYIMGRNKIGGIFQQRLLKAGINLNYVLEGVREQTRQSVVAESAEYSVELQRLKKRMDIVVEDLKDMSRIMDRLSRKNS